MENNGGKLMLFEREALEAPFLINRLDNIIYIWGK